MNEPIKYPVGRADFESIISEGFLYVDKTERMYEMIGSRKFVFLSRPRRFGKSLLVNTLQAYFEGKKELFEGLKISEYDKDWVQYPVITLDYPNNEVRIGMMQNMMYYYYPQNFSSGKASMKDFYFALRDGRIDESMTALKDFMSQIPNILNNKEEKHFQTILYVMFTWLGFYTETEVNTATGRIDVVIKNAKNIFVLELKVDGSADDALAQI
ncbi:MAG: AAA family ATPase, partial [Bacteroidales bacterium]|nr:AAA family ATPase [Bacteroidales bacterium]